MTKKKPARRPKKYDDTHLATLCEVRVEVTPHIDLDWEEEGIILTCTDKRANGREAELVLDLPEMEVLMILLEKALTNHKARNQ